MTWLPSTRPLLCLVTDRRRLSPGRPDQDACDAVVHQVEAAAATGSALLVQVRERDLDDRSLARLVARCVEAVRHSPCRLLVNDRLDVAIACGAHGAHLRGDSFSSERARELASPPFVIGRSVHGAAEAHDAARSKMLDYLVFGTVFRSGSKPASHPVGGLDRLRDVVAAAGPVPVLAIGGMGPPQAREVVRTGAAGAAAIEFFLVTDASAMSRRVRELQQSFDSSAVFP